MGPARRDTSAAGIRPRTSAADQCSRGGETPVGDREVECGHQVVEHLAGGARVHAAAPVEAEQRRVGRQRTVGAAAGELLGDQLADAGAVRDEAGLAELAAPHDQQVAVGVDVTEAQPAGLTGSQPQPVAEGEDRRGRSGPRCGARGLSGNAAAASSSRRAAAMSNRNGMRAVVAAASPGRAAARRCSSSWVTAQSSRPPHDARAGG